MAQASETESASELGWELAPGSELASAWAWAEGLASELEREWEKESERGLEKGLERELELASGSATGEHHNLSGIPERCVGAAHQC